MAVVIPVTGADGVVEIEPCGDPLPSWPQVLSPQQRTVPSWRSAQVCQPPAEMATAVVMPLTVTGVGLGVSAVGETVPLPSWPRSFCPQQRTVPSPGSAQVWKPPAVTAVAEVIPVTRTGGVELNAVVAGAPSWPAFFGAQPAIVTSGKRAQASMPPPV